MEVQLDLRASAERSEPEMEVQLDLNPAVANALTLAVSTTPSIRRYLAVILVWFAAASRRQFYKDRIHRLAAPAILLGLPS
jgi:hypothetical protein